MIIDIFLTIFLVILNGFFVAAEFAIVKVRASQIELKANKGHNLAKMTKSILNHLDAYLSATQLGITLASLGLGWIGESIVAELIIKTMDLINYDVSYEAAHQIALPVAFILITVLHIVFGELAPKSIAIRHPMTTAIAVSMPLRLFYLVFRPFIWLLNGFANLMLRSIGIKPIHGQDIHTEEELKLILTESEEGGTIKPSEHELIQNVFDFDDRVVKQILIPRTKVAAIDIESSVDEIVQRVVDEGYSRMPVYSESLDNITGIIYSKDLLKSLHSKDHSDIHDLIRPAYFVPLNKRINELLREFQTMHIQMAIVTNEFGGTAGIVTMEDIIEELVGEIQDEYDDEKPAVERKSDTEFIVNAMANLSDVNDVLPIQLPENANYDTISGLVNYIYGRIPAVNEKRIFGGYEFLILKRLKHSVDTVKLTIVDPQALNPES